MIQASVMHWCVIVCAWCAGWLSRPSVTPSPLQAVEDGQLRIIPSTYNKTWKTWLSDIRWVQSPFSASGIWGHSVCNPISDLHCCWK